MVTTQHKIAQIDIWRGFSATFSLKAAPVLELRYLYFLETLLPFALSLSKGWVG